MITGNSPENMGSADIFAGLFPAVGVLHSVRVQSARWRESNTGVTTVEIKFWICFNTRSTVAGDKSLYPFRKPNL